MLSVTVSPGLRGDAQRGGHRVGHRGRVADGGQLDQPHPVGELAGQLGRDLHGQAGLAHPAHPGQGHQPMGPHQLGQLLHLDLAAHEARRLHRQVPRHRVQRPQRRELDPQPVGADLEAGARRPTGRAAGARPDRPDRRRDTSAAVDAATRIWPP